MNSPNDREAALRQREQELRDREMQIRLRELEADIPQPPVMPTTKHDSGERGMRQSQRNLVQTAKFIGIVAGAAILFIIVFRVVTVLASVAIAGLIAWLIYKLFLERDKK